MGKSKCFASEVLHRGVRQEAERVLWERPIRITDEYVKYIWEVTLPGFGVITSHGVKDYLESRRVETTQKWKDVAEAKNKKLSEVKPFEDVKCKNCRSVMKYQWSQLINKPDEPRGEEMVLFFYVCPNKCGKQAIFEDGIPWIAEAKNSCAICGGNRSNIVTKDNTGNTYIIFECQKCGSKEVEKVKLT